MGDNVQIDLDFWANVKFDITIEFIIIYIGFPSVGWYIWNGYLAQITCAIGDLRLTMFD